MSLRTSQKLTCTVSAAFLLGSIGSYSARALECHVPSEHATIQEAIDACGDSDTVIIAAGVYTGNGNRDLDLHGKAITIRSTNPDDPNVVAGTIVDCQGSSSDPHRGFWFHSNEGPESVIAGLTIRNGYGPRENLEPWYDPELPAPVSAGGIIFCWVGSPTISRCTLADSRAEVGGAVCAWGQSSPTVTNCTIAGNLSIFGGGFCCWADVTVSSCLITGNIACIGGGLLCLLPTAAIIVNCTIANNQAAESSWYPTGGGGVCTSGPVTLTSCILWSNRPEQIVDNFEQLLVGYCNVQGGWPGEGNIDVDPLFVDPNGPDGDAATWQDNDYHLTDASPCKNTGDPNGDYSGQTDIDCEARLMGGRVDMGADERKCATWVCANGIGSGLPPLLLLLVGLIRPGRRVR